MHVISLIVRIRLPLVSSQSDQYQKSYGCFSYSGVNRMRVSLKKMEPFRGWIHLRTAQAESSCHPPLTASATTLRLISLSPRGILQWPEEQSRSGCGQDGGNADQSQHRRMWRCRSSCPLILARPSPPCQPSCSQPPPPPRRSLV